MLGFSAVPAQADPLGDRVAEFLCFPPSAERLVLTPDERARILTTPPVAGDYRDIQGSDARAWFVVRDNGDAVCRTPANGAMTVFFCAYLSLDRNILTRTPRRLCPME